MTVKKTCVTVKTFWFIITTTNINYTLIKDSCKKAVIRRVLEYNGHSENNLCLRELDMAR